MKIRNFAIAILATAALAGCATGYSYRGGAGDYYYGRPSVDYYGYGAPYGSLGYGYPGGWNGSLGYGYGGGYPYGYYGGAGYGYGYGYGYYPAYPYYPYPRNSRPRNVDRPDRNPQGYPLPDNGVRYQSRARNVLQGNPGQVVQGQYQGQGDAAPSVLSGYPSRYQGPVQTGQPTLDTRGQAQRGTPDLVRPPAASAPRSEPRSDLRFESRAPRFESAPAAPRSSFRDRGRANRP